MSEMVLSGYYIGCAWSVILFPSNCSRLLECARNESDEIGLPSFLYRQTDIACQSYGINALTSECMDMTDPYSQDITRIMTV